MFERILEPEVMDSAQEAAAYDAMDHGGVNRQFLDDLLESHANPEGRILDLGTGTARIPILLCQCLAKCELVGVDLSEQMLQLATRNVAAAELCSRISLKQIDAKNLPYHDAVFDVVLSNSIVHHIPNPVEVIAEAIRVTRPDGLLFWRDLLRPCDEAAVRQLVELYACRENDYQKKLFEDSLRAALSLEEIRELVASVGFDPSGVRVTSDRHWTWLARKPGDSTLSKNSP